MKQFIILLTAAFLSTTAAFAQDNTGTIVYEQTVRLNFEDIPELEAFAAMMPKEQTSKKILYYTPETTLYKSDKQPEQIENNVSGNGNEVSIMIDSESPNEIIYKDLKAGLSYEQKEFMGRQFMITGDIKAAKWKMTGRQKEVSGYPCQEASSIREKDTIVVWFTPAIPVMSGPGGMGNLPGIILEAYVGNELEIKAVSITPGSVDKSLMTKPRGGKKVSRDEFDKIVMEKTKELQQLSGGAGNIIIRREVITN